MTSPNPSTRTPADDLKVQTALNAQAIANMKEAHDSLVEAVERLNATVKELEKTVAASKPWTVLLQHVITGTIASVATYYVKAKT